MQSGAVNYCIFSYQATLSIPINFFHCQDVNDIFFPWHLLVLNDF